MEENRKTSGSVQNLDDVSAKLGSMQQSLSTWSRKNFSSITKKIKKLCGATNKLLQEPSSVARESRLCKFAAELDELLLREELMWK